MPVEDTTLDFRPEEIPEDVEEFTPKPLRLVGDDERLSGGLKVGDKIGLDHTFVINKPLENQSELHYAATLKHDKSKRTMRISTT